MQPHEKAQLVAALETIVPEDDTVARSNIGAIADLIGTVFMRDLQPVAVVPMIQLTLKTGGLQLLRASDITSFRALLLDEVDPARTSFSAVAVVTKVIHGANGNAVFVTESPQEIAGLLQAAGVNIISKA